MKGDSKGKRETVKRALMMFLAAAVMFSMMPAVTFAAENNGTEESAQQQAQEQTVTPSTDSTAGSETDTAADSSSGSRQTQSATTYTITARTYLNGKVNTSCGVISPSGTKTVTKGGGVNYSFYPKSGYKLLYIVVDGKKIKTTKKTYSFTNVTKNHTIYAYFSRIQLKVLIDPGHYRGYNRGCISGYYEGTQMWKLGRRLQYDLNQYAGIQADCTKKTIMTYEMGVYRRGTMAKGYDVIISMHSNYCSSSSTDYILSIVSSGSLLRPEAYGIGKKLAKCVNSTMKNYNGWQIWTKRQSDGRDWFGVIRGAADNGTPGIILEHSFHSNKRATRFLLSNSNLNKLAANEAKAIVSYYGVPSSFTASSLSVPSNFKATAIGSNKIRLTWSKTKWARFYWVYRSTSLNGKYYKIAVVSGNSYTNSKLTKNRRYFYKIRAIKTNEVRSPMTSVMSAKVK
ncbi:MAG: N-acetylmuramoyl-L-alanine amidase [Anaerovoracaceae bacterium]|jgi:N-acetylmuramoyl-L-alanine amidase